jgi:septal ring factor EnvC (AmiA/AmiB activator)
LFFRNLYPLALGAALPVVSLIFASALSNISEEEHGEDPALVDARAQKAELAKQLRETSNRLKEASERLATLESQLAERDAATSDQVAGLESALATSRDRLADLESRLADSTNRLAEQAQALADAGPLALLRTGTKREIVLAARQLFPELNKAGLAAIAKCHHQYVSQVLAEEPIPVSLDVTAEYAEAER